MGFDTFQGEKPVDEIAREAEKSEKGEILEGGVEIEMELGSRSKKERAMMQVGIGEEKEVVEFKPVEKVKDVKARSDTAAEAVELGKSDDTGSAQGAEEVGEQGREAPEAVSGRTEAPKSPFTVVVMAPSEDNIRDNEPNLSSERFSIVELRGKAKSNDSFEQVEANERMKEQMEKGKRSSSADGVVTEDKGLIEGRRSQVKYALPSEVASSKKADAKNLEQVGSTEHRDQGKPGADTVGTFAGVTIVYSDDERIFNEEELWDQILAMRTFVGYKATLHSSLWEELRALYLLTGVEPPASLKDAADLEEISKSLQFLKAAVVGVK